MILESGKYLVYVIEPKKNSFAENFSVCINPRNFWEDKGTQIDSFTNEQLIELEPVLEKIGLIPITDYMFECEMFMTVGGLKEALFEEGFAEDHSYTDFMEDSMSSEEDEAASEEEEDNEDFYNSCRSEEY